MPLAYAAASPARQRVRVRWMVKLDVGADGGIALDEKLFIDWPQGHLPHQIRLEP